MTTMKRRPKNLIAFVLAAFFAFGLLCSTFAAPGQALASASGCSQTPGPMAMAGCDYPSYLCGFDPSSNFLSEGALSSARSNNLLKNALSLAVGEASIDASNAGALLLEQQCENAFPHRPHKVSVRLFNSVLNL